MTEYAETAAAPDPLDGQYAGFWTKCAAVIMDLLLTLPMYLAVRAVCGEQHPLLGEILFTLLVLAAYVLFFCSKWQATPGMRFMNVHVSDAEGRTISHARAALWGGVSLLGMLISFSGILYMHAKFDLVAVSQLLKSCVEENIRMEDCVMEVETVIGIPYETFNMMLLSASVLAIFLLAIWSLSVALARDKSGFHNLMCGTRFIKGRL